MTPSLSSIKGGWRGVSNWLQSQVKPYPVVEREHSGQGASTPWPRLSRGEPEHFITPVMFVVERTSLRVGE